ncbi:hypothetical protein L6452_39087 [Arctium lappa]|uniref:Uncharacterized protein n=1 Tax=Arctium lappa TaxID=4217 RepID=A0ACB8XQQ4_ARCLA|nr:hypothetical protein L6452_39087 [Arctium lappa]
MSGKIGSLDQVSKVHLQMGYSVIAGKHFDYDGAIFDDLKSKIEKTERDPKIPYVRFICAYLHFLYADKYPTTHDGSFSKVGQRSLEIESVTNEASLSTLRTRLSLHSSSSAATQRVPSPAIPAATIALKQPSTTLPDAFVGISSMSSAATSTTVSVMTIVDIVSVTTPISSVLQQPPEVISTVHISSIPITPPTISLVSNPPSLSQQPHVAP